MKHLRSRYAFLFSVMGVFLSLSLVLRLALAIKSWDKLEGSYGGLLRALVTGFAFDLSSMAYLALPLALYLAVMPERVLHSPLQRRLSQLLFSFLTFFFLFQMAAEWTFWDEFNSRFNFIAVDYLIYTHEVIQNVFESYPVKTILSILLLLAALFTIGLSQRLRISVNKDEKWTHRFLPVFWALGIIVFDQALVNNSQAEFSNESTYLNELAKNGAYSFLSAVKNNQLDYHRFYREIDQAQVSARLRDLLKSKEGEYVSPDLNSTVRRIVNEGPEKRYNVMLVAVESLSAKFLGAFGNTAKLTPHLDELAEKGVLFTNLFATGTRTVRGIEALTLSLPPTPGNSIVRRPDNAGLFNIGFLFQQRGYDTKFVYGGYGYFDNMNAYFRNNGFSLVDRNSLAPDEIEFANVWGVSDEDLFRRAIKEADQSVSQGKPFFEFVLTTSNHRPYTYPQKIDLPSGQGREGAVKYTDFAIGQLIKEASKHDWFKDTIFVIVADHCAAVAGRTALPVEDFHIPLLIYAPEILAPQRISKLISQVDVAPTVAGMLNLSYESKFFGVDVMKNEPARALLGTYQKLGLYKNDGLVVLGPMRSVDIFKVDPTSYAQELTALDRPGAEELLLDAIAYYQGAFRIYSQGLYRH